MTSGDPSMLAPVALTPFTVSNPLFVSNVHSSVPSSAAYPRMPPSIETAITAPGIAVVAPPCDALQRGVPAHSAGDGGGALHTSLPVATSTALTPPGVGVW